MWYVCFFVALALLLLLVRIAVARSMGKIRMLYVLLLGAAASFVLYIPYFFPKYDFFSAFFGDLINVLKIAMVDADYMDAEKYATIISSLNSEVFAQIYSVGIGVLHVLLPALLAMTAVTLIMQCLTQMQISLIKHRKRSVHILSHINERAEMLARNIRAKDKHCDIIFLDPREDRDYSDLRNELRCSVLDEQIENLDINAKKRKVRYYCISSDEERNLNEALSVMNFLEDKPWESQQNTSVFLFSSDPDAELLMDSINKGFVNLIITDEEMTAVYRLMERHPLPHYAKDGKISVLISGFNQTATAALRTAAWCGQLSGYDLSITLVARDAEREIADFKAHYPGLFTDTYNIRCFSYRTEAEFRETVRTQCPDANYVIVCEEEKDVVEKSVTLRRLFYRIDDSFTNAPAIFAYVENPEKAEAITLLRTAEAKAERRMPYNIVPFGMVTDLYTLENLSESDLEGFAKNVHLVYEDIFSEKGVDVVPALERYNFFEVNKKSNRANALHIRYKLAMLGLDYTDDPNAEEVNLADYLAPDVLLSLTVAEHDRWQAFLESEGWETASVEQSKAYQASGISKGRHQCPLLKMHPYICPFDDLPGRGEALNLPDSTVYDRDLITRIPDILHDRWGVSGKRYKIVKRTIE